MLHVGVATGAKTHHQVGVFGHHVQQRDGHLQGQVNLGVGLGELAQARDQDGARKGGGDRQAQFAFARRSSRGGKLLQHGQTFAHMGQVFAALGGERKIGPTKQLGANDLLQLLDAVAHGAGRDAQLLGGLRDAAQARQRLKRQQALDGRNAGGGHAPTIIRGPRACPCSPISATCGSCHV